MLRISVPITPEAWDEKKQEFVEPKYQVLQLEHSLVSLSKWESKWCKAFFSKRNKTPEETIDYIKCMTITQNVKPEVYEHLTRDNISQIEEYIAAPMTAVYFPEEKSGKINNETVTSELIYYWMIVFNIPVEFQKWHLNRLITLIRVCNLKSQPPKKRNSRDIAKQNAALNAARRKQLNTRG
jgi:hypothetical protein